MINSFIFYLLLVLFFNCSQKNHANHNHALHHPDKDLKKDEIDNREQHGSKKKAKRT